MASLDMVRHETYRSRRRRDRREFLAIYLTLFPVFFAVAAISRMVGRQAVSGPRQSILAEARSSAASAIPFAFR